MYEAQGHSATELASRVKEKSEGFVAKTSPECDSVSVSVRPGPVPSCSSDLLWLVCAELLDSFPVVKAASQLFSKVQVFRPADIVEDFVFEKLLTLIPGCSHCLIGPRDTFNHKMRGMTAPDIYGMTALSSEVKSRVRAQTLAAFRCAELAARLLYQGTPWIIEGPVSKEPSRFSICRICRKSTVSSLSGVAATRVSLQEFGCSQHNFSRIVSNVKLDVPCRGKVDADQNYFLYAGRKMSASTGAMLCFPYYGKNWRARSVTTPTSLRRPATSRSRLF